MVDPFLEHRLVTYVMIAEKSYSGKFMRNFVLIAIFLFCFMIVMGYFVALADIIPDVLEHLRGVGGCKSRFVKSKQLILHHLKSINTNNENFFVLDVSWKRWH